MSDAAHFYQQHGYSVARNVFPPNEVARLRAHYMALRGEGAKPGDYAGVPLPPTNDPTQLAASGDDKPDPLQQYPRMLHMHRWDQPSLDWLLDSRLRDLLTEMLGIEPYAVQTMLYFKPPGARGQALHQDQFYLKVQPGTCLAAWLALDDCDEENGCMQIVDGSHNWDVLCTIPADTTQSFTDVTVPLPEGVQPSPMLLKAGDVLFFNGQIVHGSFSNRSKDRFRRSLIGHYIVGDARKVGEFYHPVLRFDGSQADLGVSEGATQCGIWVDANGQPVIEMVRKDSRLDRAHE